MSKRIEELVESIKRQTDHFADQDFYDVDIERILKEFAIEMCEKQREICAENASLNEHDEYDRHDDCTYTVSEINQMSILNSPFRVL